MAEFELSSFQKDILAFFKSHPHNNMFIEASAGSSKTFILVEMSKITTSSDVYIAFNNSIAEEVRSKIENKKVKVYTIHALALSIMNTNLKNHPTKKVEIGSGIGVRRNNDSSDAKLDNFKIQTIIDEMIDESEGSYCDYDQRIFLKDNYSTLYNLCRLTCTDLENPLYVGKLMQDYQLFETDKENIEIPNVFDICKNLKELDTLSAVMFDQTNIVDFTDMVYITYNKLKSGEWQVPYWHLYTNIMVDECVPGTSYVYTQEGKAIPIRILYNRMNKKQESFFIKSFNTQTETFEFKKVLNVKKKGTQKVFRVKTEGLNKVTATANHPVLTQRGFVPVSELKIGEDYLYLDKPQNQKAKYILNDDQLQLVLASSIGDGCLKKMSKFNTYRIGFTQGDAQYNYFSFKKRMMNCSFERKLKSGYTQKMNVNQTTSKIFLLPSDKWTLMKKADERFFAIWYQDDGCISLRKDKNQKQQIAEIRIACNNLSLSEATFMKDLIKEKIGVDTVLFKSRKYNELRFNKHEAETFLKRIAPYMNEDCAYKNPYFQKDNLYSWNPNFKSYGGNFVQEIIPQEETEVYDIEVEDNHNFVLWEYRYAHKTTGVVVHNCQDLSKLQQKFLAFIKRQQGRYVFSGDSHQAIYHFAAADAKSVESLHDIYPSGERFNLPICYRCPVSHLDYVKYKLPEIDIRPRPNAPEGEIDEIEKEEIVDYVQPGDMVISRKNKWLAPVILDLAKEGISIFIQDKDFVNNVFKSLKRANVKKLDTLQNKLTKSISNFKKNIKIAQELSNEFDHMSPEDKVKAQKEKVETILDSNTQIDVTNFILVILNNYIEDHPNGRVEDFERFLKHILNTTPKSDAVRICSIHKAKGLEADNIFVLNRGDWTERYGQTKEQLQQEKNLSYIAWTRAKDKLYLVGEPEAEEHDDNELPQDDGNFFFL